MSDNAILDRMKKLYALTSSSNVHEAAVAAEKLSELLLRHSLTIAEVETHDLTASQSYERSERFMGLVMVWERQLMNAICDTHDARLVYFTKKQRGRWCIVAREDSVQPIWFLYDRLVEEIRRLAEDGWAGLEQWEQSWVGARRWKRSFCVGCVDVIRERFRAMRERVVIDTDSMALVPMLRQRANDEVLRLFPKVNIAKETDQEVYGGARRAGEEAAWNIRLAEELDTRAAELKAG